MAFALRTRVIEGPGSSRKSMLDGWWLKVFAVTGWRLKIFVTVPAEPSCGGRSIAARARGSTSSVLN